MKYTKFLSLQNRTLLNSGQNFGDEKCPIFRDFTVLQWNKYFFFYEYEKWNIEAFSTKPLYSKNVHKKEGSDPTETRFAYAISYVTKKKKFEYFDWRRVVTFQTFHRYDTVHSSVQHDKMYYTCMVVYLSVYTTVYSELYNTRAHNVWNRYGDNVCDWRIASSGTRSNSIWHY